MPAALSAAAGLDNNSCQGANTAMAEWHRSESGMAAWLAGDGFFATMSPARALQAMAERHQSEDGMACCPVSSYMLWCVVH